MHVGTKARILHEDLEASKIGGLLVSQHICTAFVQYQNPKIDGLGRSNKSVIVILVLAGVVNTNVEIKLERGCLNIYNKTLKGLKSSNNTKVFTVIMDLTLRPLTFWFLQILSFECSLQYQKEKSA
ncbi:hypothetical protein BCV71DRAFT_238762 [Rhizopus microsporus]|uniref:Uncharacterized protein n=1 Tax=Rhizopus microsporus TaxID=58291 RepID=A0A1X0RPX0_RHIZD|nr:hypothetical protein BCV71DRAFT_238762 [Rhizopus microsporus]